MTHMILAKEDIYKDLFHLGPASLEEGALEAVERYLKKGDGGRAGKR